MGRSILFFVLGFWGCGLRLSPPPDPVTRPVLSPEESWARVLTQRVDAEGRIDFAGLHKDPTDLFNFVSYLATFSPESDELRFPTAASKLAYYINAYNALALYAVVDSDRRPSDLRRFFSGVKMVMGGELHSLDDVEGHVRELKDPRAFFALSVPAGGAPRLAPNPYAAGSIEQQLEHAARTFLNDPRNVRVDRTLRVVRLSDVLRRHKKDLLARAVSLPAYVNRFRTDKVPEQFKVEFLPFDASLRSQGPEPAAKGRKAAKPKAG